MAFLKGITGTVAGKRYDISRSKTKLGRSPSCQIVIGSDSVSRIHCEFGNDVQGVYVMDCGSRNKTYVNDDQLEAHQPAYLFRGDRVGVCGMLFEVEEAPERPAPRQTKNRSTEVVDGSRLSSQVYIEDMEAQDSSTIMSKLDVSSDGEQAYITSTPGAKLKALIDIAKALSRTLSLDAVLPKALDGLFTIFTQADRGFIVLKTADGALIPRWTKLRREEQPGAMRISRTIINEVLNSKRAVLSRDVKTDERFEESQSVVFDCHIRSMMCAPLLDGEGNAIGVLQIDTVFTGKAFREEDLEVMATVALQAGIAIDNAQMHERALLQKQLERDLEVAQQVQEGFLPETSPNISDYEFYHFYRPAHHVGGDYFDYLELPDGRWAIVIADVVGHGIAAALMMAKVSAEFRGAFNWDSDVAKVMTRLNRALVALQQDRFVTMVLIMLDPKSGKLQIANAGHPPPLHRKTNGNVVPVGREASNVPLGVFEGIDYELAEAVIQPGEALVMWTDGIHETMNSQNQELGMTRLEELLADCHELNPETIGTRFIEAARQHGEGQEPDDDMCLVAFTRSADPATRF